MSFLLRKHPLSCDFSPAPVANSRLRGDGLALGDVQIHKELHAFGDLADPDPPRGSTTKSASSTKQPLLYDNI
jgi:hypothetical protein